MEEAPPQEPRHLIRLTPSDMEYVALMAEGAGYKPGEYEVGITEENGGTEFVIIPKNLPKAS